jgi:hypothetical protein
LANVVSLAGELLHLAVSAWHPVGICLSCRSNCQTRLLPNFAGGDRAMLAELGHFGRFRSSQERLFLKRFHGDVSLAFSKELTNFFSIDGKAYSRRDRQLKTVFSVRWGKPIGVLSKSICVILAAAQSVKITGHLLVRKEARNAAEGIVRRRNMQIAT